MTKQAKPTLEQVISTVQGRREEIAKLWQSSRDADTAAMYLFASDELEAVQDELVAFHAAVKARLRTAQNSVAAHGLATEAPVAVRELTWLLGEPKEGEEQAE